MTRASFSVVEVKRAVAALKACGLPVEKYKLVVDGARFELLPVAVNDARDADLDVELEAFRRSHGHG